MHEPRLLSLTANHFDYANEGGVMSYGELLSDTRDESSLH